MAADGTADGATVGRVFEKVEDKSVYWTTSFYISAPRVPRSIAAKIQKRDVFRKIRDDHVPSRELSEAIEPLFNDISDRERAGKIDDFLFSVDEAQANTWIEISMPADVTWVTEGISTTSRPPGFEGPQRVRVRRFWYVHRDGGISWHLSFWMTYGPPEPEEAGVQAEVGDDDDDADEVAAAGEDFGHSPGLLYFLSRLQKVLAPKEFARADGQAVPADLRVHHTDRPTGIAPLDETEVRLLQKDEEGGLSRAGAAPTTFWGQIGAWFRGDVDHLFGMVDADWKTKLQTASPKRYEQVKADPFLALVSVEPFLEIPGLHMPRFRFMFFFVDRTFFDRLLPLDTKTGLLIPRAKMVHENCYIPFLKQIDRRTKKLPDGSEALELGADYWDWALTRKDVARKMAKALAVPGGAEAVAAYRADKPAWKDDRRPDCLNYLFLSGFNQNIIDFMAQDASEVLDSLDPIYPTEDDDSDERFFIRYANQRGFITYVRASRSLETGNDYIGTCPYAFLIHVLTLHNEYLARDYEARTEVMIDAIREDNDAEKPGDAVERFYRFRTGDFSDYARHRYGKVFRYDTEAVVFEEIQQRRGIERKTDYLTVIVENLEKQTADLQARLQKREDRQVTYAVGAVGIFGLFSLYFDIVGALGEVMTGVKDNPLFIYGSVGLTFAVVVGVAIVLAVVIRNDLVEDQRNKIAREQVVKLRDKEWVDPVAVPAAPRKSAGKTAKAAGRRR